jgi:hypothetical protein
MIVKIVAVFLEVVSVRTSGLHDNPGVEIEKLPKLIPCEHICPAKSRNQCREGFGRCISECETEALGPQCRAAKSIAHLIGLQGPAGDFREPEDRRVQVGGIHLYPGEASVRSSFQPIRPRILE